MWLEIHIFVCVFVCAEMEKGAPGGKKEVSHELSTRKAKGERELRRIDKPLGARKALGGTGVRAVSFSEAWAVPPVHTQTHIYVYVYMDRYIHTVRFTGRKEAEKKQTCQPKRKSERKGGGL